MVNLDLTKEKKPLHCLITGGKVGLVFNLKNPTNMFRSAVLADCGEDLIS